MPPISPFEREVNAGALSQPGTDVPPGTALTLMPNTADFLRIFQIAISPALHDNGFRTGDPDPAFDSRSWLSDIVRRLKGAELIIADLTALNGDVMYALGLSHALGRCPLLISQGPEVELPFNLRVFRRIQYTTDERGVFELRENLARAIRIFLAKAEASRNGDDRGGKIAQ